MTVKSGGNENGLMGLSFMDLLRISLTSQL